MKDDSPNVILDPGRAKPGVWISKPHGDAIHYFPTHGPKHHTRRCWCDPEIVDDIETGLPFFIHKEALACVQVH